MRLRGKLLLVPIFLLAGLLALYGLFALAYNGDGGTTYVTLAGHRTNAHLVGAVCLAFAVLLSAVGVRRSRS